MLSLPGGIAGNWDLGGLTDINGNLGKPVPSGHVLVPGTIELVGEAIRWELGGPARCWNVVEQGRHAMAAEVVAWLTCWRTERMRGLSDFSLQWNPGSERWELRLVSGICGSPIRSNGGRKLGSSQPASPMPDSGEAASIVSAAKN